MEEHFYEYKGLKFTAFYNESFGGLVFDTKYNNGKMLDELYIPKMIDGIEVTEICNYEHIEGLLRVVVDEDNKFFSTIDGVLFSKNKTVLKLYPFGRSEESYTIPDGVKLIDDSAFWNDHLRKIILPRGLETIDTYGFACCKNLEEITLPKSLKYVLLKSFLHCKNLKKANYEGSEQDWKNIRFDAYTEALMNAQIDFNYKYPDQ